MILHPEEKKKGAFAEKEPPIPYVAPEEVISEPGDLWQRGVHKLICGDSLKPEIFEILMAKSASTKS